MPNQSPVQRLREAFRRCSSQSSWSGEEERAVDAILPLLEELEEAQQELDAATKACIGMIARGDTITAGGRRRSARLARDAAAEALVGKD